MKEISIEELKFLQLEIAEKIHIFCDKNDIRYSLAYGSLIGAIRHKGYIPWDDDIDFCMPRPDYERFLKTFNGTYPELTVVSPEINLNYYAPYANVFDNRTLLIEERVSHRNIDIGVKIDIFPIDGTPQSEEDYKYVRNKAEKLSQSLSYKITNLRFLLSDANAFIRMLAHKILVSGRGFCQVQSELNQLVTSNSFETSQYVDQLCFPVYKNPRMNKEIFEDYIDVPFEDKRFKAIKKYDVYLRTYYGDYMQLPPEDKRIAHHLFHAYWL